MKKQTATIQVASRGAVDGEGMQQMAYTAGAVIDGILLPYSNNRAAAEFGYTGSVQFRFYYRGHEDGLTEGNQLLIGGASYPIVYVADYGRAMAVLLDTSSNSTNRAR